MKLLAWKKCSSIISYDDDDDDKFFWEKWYLVPAKLLPLNKVWSSVPMKLGLVSCLGFPEPSTTSLSPGPCGQDKSAPAKGRSLPVGLAHTPFGGDLGSFGLENKQHAIQSEDSPPTSLCILERRWEDKALLTGSLCIYKLSTKFVNHYYLVLFKWKD